MCGIAGIVSQVPSAPLTRTLEQMISRLVHRGPDDSGVWADAQAGVALGQRRLAIIDLSPQGHQPMVSASGRYVTTYNGEIYNFTELRGELESRGLAPQWRGHSDTECMLAAFDAYGIGPALQRLVGMFAIAVWDRETRTLTLARDRLGEKPLYYGAGQGGLVFASELRALLEAKPQGAAIDRQAVAEFARFGCVPGARSIYEGVHKLPAGHFVQIDARGGAGEVTPFWRLDAAPHDELARACAASDDETLIQRVHDQLELSVRQQMIADVPLGAFLSGGIDSSTVVALMQAQSSQRVRTYTIGFDDEAFDEAPFARQVADHLGTDHTEFHLTGRDALDVVPDLARIYDEPFADSSQVPTILVSRMARQHVTVTLSGDGGDELFGGYRRYAAVEDTWRRTRLLPRPVRSLAGAALRGVSVANWDRVAALPLLGMLNGRRAYRLAGIVACDSLADMHVRYMSQWQAEDHVVAGGARFDDPLATWHAAGSPLQQMRRWDLGQYLCDDLLAKVDRAAMSTSLETRAPLLDHRMVELAFAMPDRVLRREGQSKWILRRVLDRYVPRHLVDRPKIGFTVPLAQWLRGPLREWAETLLDPAVLRSQGYFNEAVVRSAWAEHLAGTSRDLSAHLWNIMMFQAWLAHASSAPAPAPVVPQRTAAAAH